MTEEESGQRQSSFLLAVIEELTGSVATGEALKAIIEDIHVGLLANLRSY